MKVRHHELEIELDDAWWEVAGMKGFVPKTRCYRTDHSEVEEIPIVDIAPARRATGVRIFNDSVDEGASAQERVIRILSGFRSGQAIPPVEITDDRSGKYRYKLTHGTHRFYCSLAAGFTHVPTVRGFEW